MSLSALRKRVAYFYDPDIGSYYYGPGHPMKPQRIRMAHALVLSYDLYKHMEVYRPHKSIEPELCLFHSSDYISFLSSVSPENYKEFSLQLKNFNVGEATDCPVFDGLFTFQQACAGTRPTHNACGTSPRVRADSDTQEDGGVLACFPDRSSRDQENSLVVPDYVHVELTVRTVNLELRIV